MDEDEYKLGAILLGGKEEGRKDRCPINFK
jgi:hypothetical protein